MFWTECISFNKSKCLFCPQSISRDEWPINWSWRHFQAESRQRQKLSHQHLVLVIKPKAPWRWQRIVWTVFFEHADTPGRRSREPPITKQPGAPLFDSDITSECGDFYFQRGTKMQALMMSPVCQIPCMCLARHWLSMKRFLSGSAVMGERANAVTPEPGTKSFFAARRLFDIVTRLLLCFQARPHVRSWTLRHHAERCSFKTQG